MAKLKALQHQLNLVKSESPIVILNWRRAEGATTAMFLKWLYSGQSSLMVDYRDEKFTQCRNFLEDNDIKFTVTGSKISGHRRIVLEGDLSSIDFYSASSFVKTVMVLRPNHYLWLIDNVDMYFNERDVKRIVERLNHKQQIIFSCDYSNLGWRHLKYDRGEAITNPTTGKLVAREYSWDGCLINWDHEDLKRQQSLKADTAYYIKEVEIL